MIIDRITKSIQTRSDKPNENWTHDSGYIVVDDNSAVAEKILNNYPNINILIENDQVVDVLITAPEKTVPTREQVNAMVVNKIREKYDVNDEFEMINLGLTDQSNSEFTAYRDYVKECRAWGDAIKKGM